MNKVDFLSEQNILESYQKAKKSRKTKEEVFLFDMKFAQNIVKIKNDLKNHTYEHGMYKKIILFDSKKRFIHSPFFKDHIVHHMVYQVLYSIFDKKFIKQTYACRKWYWVHRCIKDMQKTISKLEWEYFYLKMDISKYFYSIPHIKLKKYIFKTIKNPDLVYTISNIIDSYKTGSQFDNLFLSNSKYIKNKNKWIPIWSIISQLFANLYLHQLDHKIKHDLKVKYYFRYMDDFVIIWKKEELNLIKQKIFNFLIDELDLLVHPFKTSFNLVSDWINFVWYKIKNWKIYVWKRTKLKTNKFLDALLKLDKTIFNNSDISQIRSSYNSRIWVFLHSSFWMNYFSKRENIDFSSWG